MNNLKQRGKMNDGNISVVRNCATRFWERDRHGIDDHDGHCVPEDRKADDCIPSEKDEDEK